MRSSLSMRSWLERDLHLGDLRTLSEIAYRLTARPGQDPVERLCKRGFLVKTDRAPYFCRMTLKGYCAVLLRQTIARKDRPKTLDVENLDQVKNPKAPASTR